MTLIHQIFMIQMMFARKNLKMNIVMTKNHVSVTYQNVIRAAIGGVQNPQNASKVNIHLINV